MVNPVKHSPHVFDFSQVTQQKTPYPQDLSTLVEKREESLSLHYADRKEGDGLILFSFNSKIVTRLNPFLSHIPGSGPNPIPEGIEVPDLNPKLQSCISVGFIITFLQAIISLQTPETQKVKVTIEGAKNEMIDGVAVTTRVFNVVPIVSLKEHGKQESKFSICSFIFQKFLNAIPQKWLSTDLKADYFSKIGHNLTLAEYTDKVEAEKNSEEAFRCASYHLNKSDIPRAITWLVNAQYVLGSGQKLDEDKLAVFFNRCHCLEDAYKLFKKSNKPLVIEAAKSEGISEVIFNNSRINYSEIINGLCYFIAHSKSVKNLVLNVTNFKMEGLSDRYIDLLAKALKLNTSLTSIQITQPKLTDNGAIKILQAIRQNPSQTLETLTIESINLTDSSAKEALRTLKTKENITDLTLCSNSINFNLQSKLDSIGREHQAELDKKSKEKEEKEKAEKASQKSEKKLTLAKRRTFRFSLNLPTPAKPQDDSPPISQDSSPESSSTSPLKKEIIEPKEDPTKDKSESRESFVKEIIIHGTLTPPDSPVLSSVASSDGDLSGMDTMSLDDESSSHFSVRRDSTDERKHPAFDE